VQWQAAFSKLLDPYEFKARLIPGLLLLVPPISFIALAWGAEHPIPASLSSILVICGGPYALAAFVRTWGQRAQEKLFRRWGGAPSTILLRHRDQKLAEPTKQQYHQLIQTKLNIKIPNGDAERSDPRSADAAYVAAADALRPLAADKKKYPFVFKELVAYGFNRNCYGIRWFGLMSAAATVLAISIHVNFLQLFPTGIHPEVFREVDVGPRLTLLLSMVLMLLWMFHFTARTVEQAGYSYARRLYETLSRVPKQAGAANPPKVRGVKSQS